MIKKIKVDHGSSDWHEFRGVVDPSKLDWVSDDDRKFLTDIGFTGGFGGSEIGTLLDLTDKYLAKIKLFHRKLGALPEQDDNKEMFWGRYLEDTVADMWQYFDGTEEGYISNYNEGKRLRKCQKDNGYIVNSKYPYLFYSKDRSINKNQFRLDTGEISPVVNILECKTVSEWARKKWKLKIDPAYSGQLSQGLMVCEAEYGEIALFDNGRNFWVYPFARSESMQRLFDRIQSVAKHFWYERILPAREAMVKYGIEGYTPHDIPDVIQKYEPDVENTEAYKHFLAEWAMTEDKAVEGNHDLYDMARRHEVAKAIKKAAEGLILQETNTISKWMSDIHCDTINFKDIPGLGGKVTYKRNKNGVISFRNYIDFEADQVMINEYAEDFAEKIYKLEGL